MGKIYVFVGKSGSGKDYVMTEVCKRNPFTKKLIRYTTRPKRFGEVDGNEYHFVTNEDYKKFKDSDMIIEEEQFTVESGDVWTYFTAIDGSLDFNSSNDYLTSAHLKAALKMKEVLGEDNVFIIYIDASDKTRLKRCINRDNNCARDM